MLLNLLICLLFFDLDLFLLILFWDNLEVLCSVCELLGVVEAGLGVVGGDWGFLGLIRCDCGGLE